uniref:Uncharacterized protein n=1 Tax=Setaria digitata TaxID=48799 RepID=A0A915PX58_9BILA
MQYLRPKERAESTKKKAVSDETEKKEVKVGEEEKQTAENEDRDKYELAEADEPVDEKADDEKETEIEPNEQRKPLSESDVAGSPKKSEHERKGSKGENVSGKLYSSTAEAGSNTGGESIDMPGAGKNGDSGKDIPESLRVGSSESVDERGRNTYISAGQGIGIMVKARDESGNTARAGAEAGGGGQKNAYAMGGHDTAIRSAVEAREGGRGHESAYFAIGQRAGTVGIVGAEAGGRQRSTYIMVGQGTETSAAVRAGGGGGGQRSKDFITPQGTGTEREEREEPVSWSDKALEL